MVLAINLDRFNNLAPWKRRAVRHVMGDLMLGDPAVYTTPGGIRVAAFSDDRFTVFHARLLGSVVMAIATMPDEPTGTHNDQLIAEGVPADAMRFFDSIPAGWAPEEAE